MKFSNNVCQKQKLGETDKVSLGNIHFTFFFLLSYTKQIYSVIYITKWKINIDMRMHIWIERSDSVHTIIISIQSNLTSQQTTKSSFVPICQILTVAWRWTVLATSSWWQKHGSARHPETRFGMKTLNLNLMDLRRFVFFVSRKKLGQLAMCF